MLIASKISSVIFSFCSALNSGTKSILPIETGSFWIDYDFCDSGIESLGIYSCVVALDEFLNEVVFS